MKIYLPKPVVPLSEFTRKAIVLIVRLASEQASSLEVVINTRKEPENKPGRSFCLGGWFLCCVKDRRPLSKEKAWKLAAENILASGSTPSEVE